MPWSRLFGPGRPVALTKQVAAWSPMSFRRNSADSLPAVNRGRMAPQKPGREMEGKSLRGVQKGHSGRTPFQTAASKTSRNHASCAWRASATPLQQRQRLLHREQHALHVDLEDRVVELLGDRAQGRQLRDAGIGEDDVEPALLPLDLCEEAIEVAEVRHVSLDAGHIASDLLNRAAIRSSALERLRSSSVRQSQPAASASRRPITR